MHILKPIGLTLVVIVGMTWLASCATTQKPPPVAPVAAKPVPEAPAPAAPVQPGPRSTNAAGRAIIEKSEGVHLNAYQDNGQWFIGYGHSKDVKPGLTIDAATAERYLSEDLAACEAAVSDAVKVPVTDNQFGALVSLCYNIGALNLTNSTLVKRLNAGDTQAAADAFLDWSKATVNGQRVVLPRLLTRRQQERALFLEGLNPPRA